MSHVKTFKEFFWDRQGWPVRFAISWFFVVMMVFGAVLDGWGWMRKRMNEVT